MNYRYPGPQSFREEDEILFHGRKRETQALYDLLLVQPLIVLFAKSGMGKTSLLQAGIIPKLVFSEYDPIKIRLNQTGIPLETQVIAEIWPGAPKEATIWEAVRHYNDQHRGTPVLIFDQFEEVFTLYAGAQGSVFERQMADLINGYLPDNLRANIRAGLEAGNLSAEAATEAERPPKFRIVLAIRSDLLHYLHLLSKNIPSILRNRFELPGLKPEQAEEAIVQPAAQPRELGDYASPAFAYSPEAVQQILGFLSQRKNAATGNQAEPEVESFQLQLFCEYIERKVLEKTHKKPKAQITVHPEFYGGEAGIKEILDFFYHKTLEGIAEPEQRENTRRLLEDHLVRNENRVAIDEATIQETQGVNSPTLAYLVDKRLIRRDTRDTGNYYEISHDTLLLPILKSKARWDAAEAQRRAREAEAIAESEAIKRAESDRLRTEAESGRRRARNMTALAFLVAAVAVLLGIYAFQQQQTAEKSKEKAEFSLRQLQAKEFIQKGNGYYTLPRPDYEEALRAYQKAFDLDSTNARVNARIDSCRLKLK